MGRGFESLRGHLKMKQLQHVAAFFYCWFWSELKMVLSSQRIFPVGMAIFKNKELSLPYEIRSATSRHPSGCAYRQL